MDYLLKIENPLKNGNISYSGTCQHPDIKIEGLPKSIAPGSKVKLRHNKIKNYNI